MDMPIDLPTIILTPVSEAIGFALWIGLLSGAVIASIDAALRPKDQQLRFAALVKVFLFTLSLYAVMFAFFVFVVLSQDPVKPLEAVNKDVLVLAVSLILGSTLSKVPPFSTLFQQPAKSDNHE